MNKEVEMVSIPKIELERLRKKAGRIEELERKIEEHQGTYNEETDEFEDNDDCDLTTIGELVLDYLDMWR